MTEVNELETIKKLLIVFLLNDGVGQEIIAKVTGMAPKTIRNQFPMKIIKSKKNE